MDADADENKVPNSIVALCAQNASVRDRNARLKYCPISPGTSAQACVDPSIARSAPSTRARTIHEITEGVTAIHASTRADRFISSRMSRHFLINGLDPPAPRLK